MPNITTNGIQIEYDTFGNPSSPPLLLIMGLGRQMIVWDEEFCDQFAGQGLYVIRFDNRDVGLSSKICEDEGLNVMGVSPKLQRNEETKVPYALDDMADDSIGLLDALGIERAHVCGVSMGGMIAQIMAIRYPSRVWSLISMLSSTGGPDLPTAKPEVIALLMAPMPDERDAYVEHMVNVFRTLAGPKIPIDAKLTRRLVERSYDRCFYPQGVAHHWAAVMASGDRTEALKSISVPTLVIHGSDDPLIPVESGKATAEAVRGAELLIIEGLGHSIPREVRPCLMNTMVAHINKAGN
jgi:pimeloyl-ACP methyl ester carboxylesterase